MDDNKEKENIEVKKSTENTKSKKLNKKSTMCIVLVSIIVIFLLIISVIFSLININNEKILNNVSIMGIDVSNMSIDKAKEAVSEVVNAKIS